MNQFFSLDGKTAVITGAGQGIGLVAAERYAAAGANLVLADLQDCTELAERLGGLSIMTDVTDEEQVKNLMRGAHQAFGHIDIVVNNAGIFAGYNHLVDSSAEEFRACFDVNVMGTFTALNMRFP